MTQEQELVREFLLESYENLERLDQDFLVLEQNPQDRQRLQSIFRTIHTLKGTCGFFGFSRLERLAHAGENLLGRLRDGELDLTPDMAQTLLHMVDRIRRLLAGIERSGTEPDEDVEPIVAELHRWVAGQPCATAREAPAPSTADEHPQSAPASRTVPDVPGTEQQSPPTQEPGDTQALPVLEDKPVAETVPSLADSTLRVDVAVLDKLMNLVGELVLTRNRILQCSNAGLDDTLVAAIQRLDLVTTELQENVMKLRMQPIGNLWNKFPRMVRDRAYACGKKVHLVMEGADTELDKTLIEAVRDPLTHILRNAIDHGIESPADRRQAGKPEEGTIVLRAYHEGGQVTIEVSDDGRGLDWERIRAKALAAGLVTAEQAARMSTRDLSQLVFLPGFSTAQQVTRLSGRGVGMDVVRTCIERIGGLVDIYSESGRGTTLTLKIPLTLAIVPALIVECAGDRYAIPQASLLKLVKLAEGHSDKCLEWVHGTPAFRLHGRLLPVVCLQRLLGLSACADACTARSLVVLHADERSFGLIVDKICDTEDIVVKPLSRHLKGIPIYAGATILGDGTVALILDVMGMAQEVHLAGSEYREETRTHQALAERGHWVTLLVVECGGQRLALPLAQVYRLEEVPASRLERASGSEVLQYRDRIMPLVRLGTLLGVPQTLSQRLPVVVCRQPEGDDFVGLIVDRIVDFVETELHPDLTAGRPSAGALVLAGRVTELLDLGAVCAHAVPRSAAAGKGAL